MKPLFLLILFWTSLSAAGQTGSEIRNRDDILKCLHKTALKKRFYGFSFVKWKSDPVFHAGLDAFYGEWLDSGESWNTLYWRVNNDVKYPPHAGEPAPEPISCDSNRCYPNQWIDQVPAWLIRLTSDSSGKWIRVESPFEIASIQGHQIFCNMPD